LRCNIRSFIWDLSVFLMYWLMAINFPLRTGFAVSHGLWWVVFSFSLNSWNYLTSSLFSSMTHWLLTNVLFSFQLFEYFLLLLLLLCSRFQFSYMCWELLCTLRHGWFWRKFHWLLLRIYIVLFQSGIFCRHLSGPFDLRCHFILRFLCWFFLSVWPISWCWSCVIFSMT
jgi:hypothetical protein